MIDTDWIDGLDGSSAADALVTVRDELRAVEAKRLLLAAHWADLHAAPRPPRTTDHRHAHR